MKLLLGTYESRLEAPNKVITELRRSLRVRVPGYQYTEAYKRGWDGYTYFINNKGKFLTGMAQYLYKKITKFYGQESISIIPYYKEDLRETELDVEIGNGWTLTQDQEQVVRKILDHRFPDGTFCPFGVIDAAVNSGKTSIFASLIRNYPESKFLIICDRTLVFRQTVKFFFGIYGEEQIGIIQGGTVRLKRITVAMVQSLVKIKDKKLDTYFDFLISDECHGMSNKRGKTALKRIQAPYRYFFSGTPYDHSDVVKKATMLGLAGPVIGKITNKHNQDLGVSLKGIVYFHKINYPVLDSDQYKYLMRSHSRNQRIKDIVEKNQDKKILIVARFTEHCEYILEHVDIPYTHGSDPDRDYKLNRFKKDPTGKLLTTFIIKEGVNIPDIQVLISVFAGKDEISVKQVAGRVIRTDGVSTEVHIHDFYDDDGDKLKDQSENRLTYYEKEGYIIKKLW